MVNPPTGFAELDGALELVLLDVTPFDGVVSATELDVGRLTSLNALLNACENTSDFKLILTVALLSEVTLETTVLTALIAAEATSFNAFVAML